MTLPLLRIQTLLLAAVAGISAGVAAAVPPPEKLLPSDTLVVLTVPDWTKARAAYDQNATSQLWRDPSMKAFREKLMKKIQDEWITPLERQVGIRFADYAGIAQGQATLAIVQNGWQGKKEPEPAWLLLIDARDKGGQLKTNLAEVRKKWTDAGKKSKTDKIRDVEFTTFILSDADLAKTLGEKPDKSDKSDEKPPAGDLAKKPTEIIFGQSDSLLIAGDSPKVLEKILARLSGGQVTALGEEAAFDSNYQARFREAIAYGWVHARPLIEIFTREAAAEQKNRNQDPDSDMPDPSKIMSVTGVGALRTVAFALKEAPDGSFAEFHVGVPESGRAGIFKILAAEAKESTPPPFVPADAVKFQRWRIDMAKGWATLEKMVTDMMPQAGGALNLMFQTVGKDKDPNFDLKRELFGNLGDDLITFQKNPKGTSLAELSSPPSLYLIGSANAEKLAAALKLIATLLPQPMNAVKEREFLGHKIYSLSLGPGFNPDGTPGPERTLNFTAGGGYLALSTEDAILESHLRSNENPVKPLRESPGLADAAQKVGGMNTGFFGYENSSETMRVTLEALKKNGDALERMLGFTPLGPVLSKDGGKLKDWVDFSLLPEFNAIAKYFYLTVYSGSVGADGLSYKFYTPTPPQLKGAQ
jgi:hypothetical protein